MVMGYSEGLDFIRELAIMDMLDTNHRKAHIKKLWEKYPNDYFEWKKWCIEMNKLPDFFGTRDNPKPIDESKL